MVMSSPISKKSYKCTIPSYTSIEYLLIHSVAWLLDCSDAIQYQVVESFDGGNDAGAGIVVLQQTIECSWMDVTLESSARGWQGAIRLLASSHMPHWHITPIQESWLDAANLTLMPILTQDKAGPVFEGAILDFIQRIESYLFQHNQTYLAGSTLSLADVVVAQILVATYWQMLHHRQRGRGAGAGGDNLVLTLPQQVHRWATTVFQKLTKVLPYATIPGWRMFGLQRRDIWNDWCLALQVGDLSPLQKEELPLLQSLPPPTPIPQAKTVEKTSPTENIVPAEAVVTTTPQQQQPETLNLLDDEDSNPILRKLKESGIAFEVYSHPHCQTADELVTQVPIPEGQAHTKNLFLRDKKLGKHFLVTLHPKSTCSTKDLEKLLGLPNKANLRLADEKTLDEKLHVRPGCVGPLCMALTDATAKEEEKVTFVLDQALLQVQIIHSHPLRNDASVKLTPTDLLSFLKQHGHVEPTVLDFSQTPPPTTQTKEQPKEKPKEKPKDSSEDTKQVSEDKSAPSKSNKKNVKKGETLLALQWKKSENFPMWYTDVIVLSEMISYYDISGCYILRPWSYRMWELIQEWFNRHIQALGVENAYFPMFVSRDRLEREKDHVEGFAPEVAWVTKSGSGDLAKPIAIRPTSETIMYPAYSDWIQSHRDLPLKLNQWSNVVRWEFKYPTPFLRTREFLWQEGHTAHSTFEEAEDMVMKALDLYRRVYEELLAVPVVPGYKTEKEKFAGGFRTTTVEAYIAGSGRAIQGATSHHLGQNFGNMFDITFQNDKGKTEVAWQTSWGLTTRTIGVMVMVHGDDTGLVLPPRVAPLQVVIVPILSKKFMPEEAEPYCSSILADLVACGVRAKYDDRTWYNPGWKYNHWEQKGVPLRIEVGPRDVEQQTARIVVRHNGDKQDLSVNGLGAALRTLLEEIQEAMFVKAKNARDTHIVQVTDWADFVPNLEKNNLVLTPWCGGQYKEWEETVKERSREESLKARGVEAEDEQTSTSVAAKSLCIPFQQPELPPGTKCIISGMDATCWIMWGRSY